MSTARYGHLVLAAILVVGCGDGGGSDGDGACPEFDPWETGGDGAPVSSPPPAGEARAGRITSEADVPTGVKNQAEVGDFMLRNSKVLFVIEDMGSSDGYNPFGGEIVHADLVGTDGEPLGLNNFGESFHGLAARLLDPTSVSVIADGSDGTEAIVRVVGEVVNMPLLDVGFGIIFFVSDGVTYSADYVLGPDAEFLEVRFNVRNPLDQRAYPNLHIVGTIQGDGLVEWTPESGFDKSGMSGEHLLYGHVGEEIGYAWMNPDGTTLQQVIVESGMLVAERGEDLDMEPCDEQVLGMVRLVVAGGGAESLLGAARRVQGEAEPDATTFELSVEGGGDASLARVHVTDPSGTYLTSVIADGEGVWSAGLVHGDYLATAVLDGHPPARDVAFTVPAPGSSVDIAIPQAGTVAYSAVDGDGAAVPVKLVVFADDPPDPLPASFGEKEYPGGASTYVFDVTGSGSFTLPPGGYSVTASRGFEYEIDTRSFSVTAGSETTVDLTLGHVVDSTGMLCGDFHVHSYLSPDSWDDRGEKVRAAIAEGVEILASTDHEWVADYAPDVEAEGLQALIYGLSGEELTTFAYGHFNVYPQTVMDDEPNDGAIVWYYRDAPDIFAEVRTDPIDPVLQINHPRSESFQGYFTHLGLDPAEGTIRRSENWTTDFDAVEVFNSDDIENEWEVVLDYFGLLNMGLKLAATGTSDTHDYVGDEIGYARTCLIVGHDAPADLSHEAVRDTVKAQKAVVSGGILVTVEGPSGELPGDVIDASGGTADIHVVVQAPLWIDADELRVFVDGAETHTITLDSTTEDPTNPVVRYDDTITVSTADGADGWVLCAAQGEEEMDPVAVGRRPFGMTNPLYLDADGDGEIAPRLTPP